MLANPKTKTNKKKTKKRMTTNQTNNYLESAKFM